MASIPYTSGKPKILAKNAFEPSVAASLGDNIHQSRRRGLYPRSMELIESADELGALGATISGAGPTVLVWSTWQDVGKVVEELERHCGEWAEIRRIGFTNERADVPEI